MSDERPKTEGTPETDDYALADACEAHEHEVMAMTQEILDQGLHESNRSAVFDVVGNAFVLGHRAANHSHPTPPHTSDPAPAGGGGGLTAWPDLDQLRAFAAYYRSAAVGIRAQRHREPDAENIFAAADALERLAAEVERLRGVLVDLSCDGCEYGDNCPSNASHYVCRPCQMQRALAAPVPDVAGEGSES